MYKRNLTDSKFIFHNLIKKVTVTYNALTAINNYSNYDTS